ncbi:hypothetical protein GLAREA_00032 [Glarea lozoyensis ATCC 20868]|uniref:Uncharacterized protein n=1 Tax=Glarea lozoyensis (strain ATCC 20868 / MF5171) TaxID=1116229 RepID=S3CV89_GLAL2|nr:uncharacterized protein GLAREA_00032 [Glarea lozoyensis ATCC 20868]EPE28874.1 hypothetical protein GLAREA_00032 [Glarea lozoyensis ATCC 20868]
MSTQSTIESVTANTHLDVRIIYTKAARHYLEFCSIHQNDSLPIAIKKLIRHHNTFLYGNSQWLKHLDVFRTATLEIATLSPYCAEYDVEAPSHEVLIESSTSNKLLTSAWSNPDILSHLEFTDLNLDVVTTSVDTDIKKAILIKTELSRFGFCIILMAFLVLCIGGGVGVGFATHSMDLGVLIATGLPAFAVCGNGLYMRGVRRG